jgi:hypothetical protein
VQTHLIEALHPHAESADPQGLVLLQPGQVKCAWVSFHRDLCLWQYAVLLLQGGQDAFQEMRG